mmetsp:Transcript_5440/g.9700  ORF Transcript_5440/g.9700 Transcript_5440/m.9700 type:complete len:169 (+) Transcript_5440:196-702(+)|eukprot:CAMPEP_0184700032 /NCGR_PEP_ID=MMETSP0313-20130426/7729_1 /TAXON_ID=2792 /ORGANISM="Porphyridium aerugineum, Strain SAG 1380-2" /LENGTH=168 /DNA_ID=CAMNT_0027159375 /DNA_START=140 /DNA_END=646 /DNA_ORIENTATION=-
MFRSKSEKGPVLSEEQVEARKRMVKNENRLYEAQMHQKNLRAKIQSYEVFLESVARKKEAIESLKEQQAKVEKQCLELEAELAAKKNDSSKEVNQAKSIMAACVKLEEEKQKVLAALRKENDRMADHMDLQTEAITAMVAQLKAEGEKPNIGLDVTKNNASLIIEKKP